VETQIKRKILKSSQAIAYSRLRYLTAFELFTLSTQNFARLSKSRLKTK